MTIRHLQIFKAVAEAGKMGQAARQLYISQPTVSKAIGDLEKEYGVLLFDRLAQKLYITEAGTRLLRYARQLLALYDEMEADLHAAAGLQAIRVGATITVGSCVLPALIRRFEQEHPGVRVQVEVESARRIEQKILNSELDLAVSEGEPESVRQQVRWQAMSLRSFGILCTAAADAFPVRATRSFRSYRWRRCAAGISCVCR